MVALGEERTIEQDTAFALRILVDIAIRALSPAVNDPTTAVQVLGAVEDLLLRIGESDLTARGTLRDGGGDVRVLIATRGWDDLLALALTEIRDYGSTSTQVTRRLRALLEDLAVRVRPEHRAAVAEQLAALDEALARLVADPADARVRRPAGPPGHRRPARHRERHHPFVTTGPRGLAAAARRPRAARPREVGRDVGRRRRQRRGEDEPDHAEQAASGDRDDQDRERVDAERGAEGDRLDHLLQDAVGQQHDHGHDQGGRRCPASRARAGR